MPFVPSVEVRQRACEAARDLLATLAESVLPACASQVQGAGARGQGQGDVQGLGAAAAAEAAALACGIAQYVSFQQRVLRHSLRMVAEAEAAIPIT